MKNIDRIVKHAEVSEKAIERYLSECVKELGGILRGKEFFYERKGQREACAGDRRD